MEDSEGLVLSCLGTLERSRMRRLPSFDMRFVSEMISRLEGRWSFRPGRCETSAAVGSGMDDGPDM